MLGLKPKAQLATKMANELIVVVKGVDMEELASSELASLLQQEQAIARELPDLAVPILLI